MEETEELSRIIEAVSRRLEFLEYAGVKDVRAPEKEGLPAPAVPAVSAPAATQEASESAVAFGVWRLGDRVVFVEGARVKASGEPFSAGHISQLERLARWMGGELGIKGFSAKDGWRKEFPTMESSLPELKGQVFAKPPGVVVAFGPLAVEALVGSPDIDGLRGRFHDADGVLVMPTHSPGAILNDPALKKQTHEDMLMVIGRLKG
ncbi:MAG: hypothetical protein Q8P48_06820 [Deltaproteobacteria bacterium]|nr:hypothetical protein [Deltaproteobacteria bacterium]